MCTRPITIFTKTEDLDSDVVAPEEFVNMIVVGLVTSITLKAVRTMWYHLAILSLGQKAITSTSISKFKIHNFSKKVLLSSFILCGISVTLIRGRCLIFKKFIPFDLIVYFCLTIG